MSVICRLSTEIKNKIAAGEVIERPASVAKELMENSLDAGATSIGLEVKAGGRKLIRVSDDGVGMTREDALLSLERHATSKLAHEDDLFDLHTLGFRGEALPSIAAVARLRLETAPRGADSGVRLDIEGGAIVSETETAVRGTVFEVRDLFFNTPVRAKFLKSGKTELGHILDTATRLALAHPEVAFKVTIEREAALELPRATSHRERLGQVYGLEFMDGLIEIDAGAQGMRIRAFISHPRQMRERRANQMLFINRRPVRDQSVNHAIHSAYEGRADSGGYPAYFVFLELDPGRVDFNVHPAKKEVRFENQQAVHAFVKRAVEDHIAGRRSQDIPVHDETVRGGYFGPTRYPSRPMAAEPPPGQTPLMPAPGSVAEVLSRGAKVSDTTASYPGGPHPGQADASDRPRPAPTERLRPRGLDLAPDLQYAYLGDTFIAIAREDGGMMLVDHHAAHERVLYEKLLKGAGLGSAQLLFPMHVQLSRAEHMAITRNLDLLYEMGIEAGDFGHDTLLISAVPPEIERADLRGVLADAAHAIMEGERPGASIREAVAARVACHSSVRGRRVLDKESLGALLRDLDASERPEQCPHGRPTRIYYSLDDLRRLFKRK